MTDIVLTFNININIAAINPIINQITFFVIFTLYIYNINILAFLSVVAMSCGFNNMVSVFEGGDGGQVCVTPKDVTSNETSSYTLYYPGKILCFLVSWPVIS